MHAVCATGLVAAGASALNQLLERHTDALMRRTENRPLPAGRLHPGEVLVVGLLLGIGGLAYVAVAWQLAGEVIIPLNREGGTSTGFRAQLLFFLDDLILKLFDKPLLSDKPERDQLSWR